MSLSHESDAVPEAEAGEAPRYCLFDTALGLCSIAWTSVGIARFQLPEASRGAAERRLQRRGSVPANAEDTPTHVASVMADARRYMAGERVDFQAVVLDLSGVGEFYRSLYAVARRVGWGQTATYGDIARQVDSVRAARAVGQAMGRNPVPLIIPCHRVLANGNTIGGFSAYGGAATKERMLALEGIDLRHGQLALPGLLR